VSVFARIDDRLIHGQVVEGWVTYLKATCIVVADDKVAANPVQRSIMEIAVPQGLRVVIGTVAEIGTRLRSPDLAKERAILLFSNPTDVLRILDAGVVCDVVNLGGMHYTPGKQKVLDVLALDESDLAALREILHRGVRVDIQTVPTERPRPLEKVFKACLRG
jgi:mannose/fructose/N-acetylgalactosamine-specific phosphotransferase system component IIB